MTRLLFAGALSLALLGLAAIGSVAAAQAAAIGDPDVTNGDPFAIVNSDGSFQDGRRIVSTLRLSTGTYDVRTNRSILRCVCLLTRGDPNSFGVGAGYGTCVQRSGSSGRGWFIQIFNEAGALEDSEFMVLGACRP